MDLFAELQAWYAAQCDGDWEHQYGITIQTCDNPGWWVKIDLTGTPLSGREFRRTEENVVAEGFQQGSRWLKCHIIDDVWNGAGDETKLPTILKIFLEWVHEDRAGRDVEAGGG